MRVLELEIVRHVLDRTGSRAIVVIVCKLLQTLANPICGIDDIKWAWLAGLSQPCLLSVESVGDVPFLPLNSSGDLLGPASRFPGVLARGCHGRGYAFRKLTVTA